MRFVTQDNRPDQAEYGEAHSRIHDAVRARFNIARSSLVCVIVFVLADKLVEERTKLLSEV